MILPGFSKPSPPAPAPVVTKKEEDTAITDAKKKERRSQLQRRGRAGAILTSGKGVQDELGIVTRPEAKSGTLG